MYPLNNGGLKMEPTKNAKRYQHLSDNELSALKFWQIDESKSDIHFIETEDHWQLAVTHYPPKEKKFPYPILLCHGLGSNRLAFYSESSRSFGQYLASNGFDVYACDLRGHGLSEKPGRTNDLRYNWGFLEYATLDMPAIIDAVLSLSSEKQCCFIGHSMGGILLYYLASQSDARIKRGITLGSSLDYSNTGSLFRLIATAAPLTHILPATPIHWAARISGYLSRYHAGAIDPFLANPKNISPQSFSQYTRTATHPVSSRVLRDLALAITGEGMVDQQGQKIASSLAEKGYPFPILAVSGSRDLQCPPEAAHRFGTEQKVFGKEYGQQEEYGHHDLLIGKRAHLEVWPTLAEWLVKT